MNEASPMPMPIRRAAATEVAPRLALRHKGMLLFVAMSLYVVTGLGLLAWYGIRSAGGPGELKDGIAPLIVAAGVIVMLGLLVFGAFLTLFLKRLATDLGRLQVRAIEVAGGLRGAPLGIERDDEVGSLARAVDKMAADLQEREIEIAEARLEQFHNERMMLLGGIAAGLAHEIGNPVAGIAAIATEIAEAQRAGRVAECDAAELVAFAQRLAALTRRLALIAGLRSRERAPIALNSVLEGVTALVGLDARFRHIEIVTELDRGLPMLFVAEDDVVQLLLHLLVNAAESFEGAGQPRPRIRVASSRAGPWVALEIADNGRGMDVETLARALEPYFTTKPAGRGNGLGLDACRRIVERYGGDISLQAVAGAGTSAKCRLPVAPVSGRNVL